MAFDGASQTLWLPKRPVNIYEVHASSWKLKEDGQPYTFKELKEELIPYLVKMNYTHVEFMPLMAHPLGMSWGYQLMGYFAFEHTYGTPEEFQDFVEACHQNNIGVLVDWVPGHYTHKMTMLWPTSMAHQPLNIKIMIELIIIVGVP